MLTQANSVRLPMADESIHLLITSPPYYGLRNYEGLAPQIMGGVSTCLHIWGPWIDKDDVREKVLHGKTRTTDRFYGDESRRFDGNHQKHQSVQFCQKCLAWRGHLGNEPTLELYVANLVEVGREMRRVLRSDGVWFLNLGDSFAGSWENYAPGGIKNKQREQSESGKRWNRPAYEDTTLRPSTSLNQEGVKPKDKMLIPYRVALALQAEGWYVRNDLIWIKKNPLPESVQDRPTVAHEYIFMLTKSPRYFWDAVAVKRPSTGQTGQAAGFTRGSEWQAEIVPGQGYAQHRNGRVEPEPSDVRQYRTSDPWLDSLDIEIDQARMHLAHLETLREEGGLLLDEAGTPQAIRTATKGFSGAHFATFPPALIRDLIRGATSEGGCCPACGNQYERIVEKAQTGRGHTNRSSDDGYLNGKSTARSLAEKRQAYRALGMEGPPPAQTLGFAPACDCDAGEPIPPIVFDPFCGTATVGEVCRKLGLRFVGADLSAEYLAQFASVRTGGKTTAYSLRLAQEEVLKKYRIRKEESR